MVPPSNDPESIEPDPSEPGPSEPKPSDAGPSAADLPFIIQPDNVSRYDDGTVFILDRRVYPFDIRFERCDTYEATAAAIEDMVTQSGGPGVAAGHGMIQAGRMADRETRRNPMEVIEAAGERLSATRPTHNQIRRVVSLLTAAARTAVEAGQSVETVLIEEMASITRDRYARYQETGLLGAELIDDGDTVLTHCWGEGGIVFTLLNARLQGKTIEAVCTETRPYLQGSRLTATAISELGIATTVITDGMHGSLMTAGRIDKFISGADLVTMSGHVINKVGTFPIAMMAHHFGVPFYPFCSGPDPTTPTPENVVIEARDPDEVLHCRGIRTAASSVAGYYPAFDITPPEFVTGVVTNQGVFAPGDLGSFRTDHVRI